MARKIVLTAVRVDGSSEFLSSRTLADNEQVNLYSEAKAAMQQRAELDDQNEQRMVRADRPRTVSVRADLRSGSKLIDRDEAHR